VQWKRQAFYLYGVVEPTTGESHFFEFSHLDTQCFQQFLNQVSQKFANSLNLMQLDNGRFHQALALEWPENIIPVFQPPHSPELNPIERLWQQFKQQLRWENFAKLDQLRQKVSEILNSLKPAVIASVCGWDYITSALSSAIS